MKKAKVIILLSLILIVLLGIIFGMVDYKRSKENKLPIFALKFSEWKSGEDGEINIADDYYGLGYKIVNCKNEEHSVKFGFYFSHFICVSGMNE